MPISHVKTLTEADSADTTLARPSNWNSNHVVALSTQDVIWVSANNILSNGYLVLTNSNGLTFGFSTNTAGGTITGSYSQNTMFSGGMSNIGNTSGISGLESNAVVLVGGNNITLSQSTNVSGATINISNQSNQTIGLYAVGNTTISTSTTVNAMAFSIWEVGAITGGMSGGSVLLSGESVQTANLLSASGNTRGTLTTYSNGTMVLAGGTNITLSQSSNTITISGPNQNISFYAVGNTTGASTSSNINFGSLTIDGASKLSVGLTNSSLEIDLVQTLGVYVIGNTTGLTTSTTLDPRILSIYGSGGMYAGLSAGRIVVYDPMLVDFEPWPNSKTTSQTLAQSSLYMMPVTIPGNLSFQMIQLGVSASLVSTSIAATTSNVSTTFNGSASVNQSINAFLFSRLQSGPLINGGTTNLGIVTSTSMSLQTSVGWSMTVSSSKSYSLSENYSVNFPTWTSGTTTSANAATTITTWQTTTSQYTASTSTTINNTSGLKTLWPSTTVWSGNKLMFIPFGTSLSAGEYWLGLQAMSATAGTNLFTAMTFSAITFENQSLQYIGSSTSGTLGIYPAQGVFSTTYSTNVTYVSNIGQGSGVIALSQVNSQASNIVPWVQFKNNIQ